MPRMTKGAKAASPRSRIDAPAYAGSMITFVFTGVRE